MSIGFSPHPNINQKANGVKLPFSNVPYTFVSFPFPFICHVAVL